MTPLATIQIFEHGRCHLIPKDGLEMTLGVMRIVEKLGGKYQVVIRHVPESIANILSETTEQPMRIEVPVRTDDVIEAG